MATGGGEGERKALTILWRIENLSYFDREFHGDVILSPIFHPHTLEDKWTSLHLFPRGETVIDENVRLVLLTESLFPVECEFSFLTCDGSPLVTHKGLRRTRFSRGFQFKMTNCLIQEELFVTKKSTFLPHDTLTIRCRLWKSEGNFQNTEFISGRSRIELAEDTILWPIVGFSVLNLRQSKFSKTFPVKLRLIHGTTIFHLKCALTRDSQQNPVLNIEVTATEIPTIVLAKLEVSILILDNRQKELKVSRKGIVLSVSEELSTLGRPLDSLHSLEDPNSVFRENLKAEMPLLEYGEGLSLLFHLSVVSQDISRFIERKYFGTYLHESGTYIGTNLEQDRTRTLSTFSEASCQALENSGDIPAHLRKVSTFSEASSQTSENSGDIPARLPERNDCLGILREDFLSLYQKQEFSDFELRAGEVCFPVHKNILCARSPVFRFMFSSRMQESNSKSLEVPDLDAHALNRMLTFLYTGNVEPDLPLERVADLYYAADKYQIDSLKNMCSSILQSQICVSNVCDILSLADRHQDSDLTSFVYNFILSHFDDVMDSEEWEKFMGINSALAGKTTHLLYRRKRERKEEEPKNS